MKGFETHINDKKRSGFVVYYGKQGMYGDGIVLRGKKEELWTCPCETWFNSEAARDEYLKKVYSAITSELFGDIYDGKPRFGEACRMRNDSKEPWEEGYFLAETKFKDKPFILTRGKNDKDNAKLYAFCEPIRKRMPITEQVGEIITYKWKED